MYNYIYKTYNNKINMIIDNYKLLLSLLDIEDNNCEKTINFDNIIKLSNENIKILYSLKTIITLKNNNCFYFTLIDKNNIHNHNKIYLIKIKIFQLNKKLLSNIDIFLIIKYIKYLIFKFTKLTNIIESLSKIIINDSVI